MPYCTQTDIEKQIPATKVTELTDDEGTGAKVAERVTEAIAKADALIDSYCGAVEAVPFTVVPAIVKQHSITIAVYFLYSRRVGIPDHVEKNFNNAVSHLKDISTGKAVLAPTTSADVAASPQASHTSDDKKMTMGKKSDGSSGTLDNY